MVLRITPHHENKIPLIPQQTEGLELFEKALGRKRKAGWDNNNRHHLFFDRAVFSDDPLLNEFREHPLCIALVDRDWHKLIHRRFDRSPVPERDVVLSFLDEANLLQRWVRSLAEIKTLSAKGALVPQIADKIDRLEAQAQEDEVLIPGIEVMPFDMREMVIQGLLKMAVDPTPILNSFKPNNL